ncbi:RNI-like protein [Backusella circina FSU 941]|nr:RNI-like protein [Backusella circina FSU 941]
MMLTLDQQHQEDSKQVQNATQLLSLYERLCKAKGEPTIDKLVVTLLNQPQATSLTRLDLTNQFLDRNNIEPFADLMSLDFGLKELLLDNCRLEDDAIKILMHSLLLNDQITYLSLANNPKIKTNGFKYIAVYIKGSTRLITLDLSYTQPDKRSIEYLSTAMTMSQITRLFLDGCHLRVTQFEQLSYLIKNTNTIKHISLRYNRVMNQQSALWLGVFLRDYDNALANGLQYLDISQNDLNQGIQYIAQALRRNINLQQLAMRECNLDAKGCALIGEALKYNRSLKRLDIALNSLCLPNIDGIKTISKALCVNTSLKGLCLSETGLVSEALVALSEFIPKNNSLVRLDLSKNIRLDFQALTTISSAIKTNNTLCFVDINIPSENPNMVDIHNDILATCTNNALIAKNNEDTNKTPIIQNNNNSSIAHTTARLSLQERLAAVVSKGKMINMPQQERPLSPSSPSPAEHRPSAPEPQEPQVQIPPSRKKKKSKPISAYVVESDENVIQKSLELVALLEEAVSMDKRDHHDDFDKCKQIQEIVCQRIPLVEDSDHLELLLGVNDRLTSAIQAYNTHTPSPKQQEEEQFEIGDDDDDGELEDIHIEEEDDHLRQLRSEIEAEESAAFLKAKQNEKSTT